MTLLILNLTSNDIQLKLKATYSTFDVIYDFWTPIERLKGNADITLSH